MGCGAEGPTFHEPSAENPGSTVHLGELSEMVQFRQKYEYVERQMCKDSVQVPGI